jgi:hypothetical protein
MECTEDIDQGILIPSESIQKVEPMVRKMLDAISQNLKGNGIDDGNFAIAEIFSQVNSPRERPAMLCSYNH